MRAMFAPFSNFECVTKRYLHSDLYFDYQGSISYKVDHQKKIEEALLGTKSMKITLEEILNFDIVAY